MPPSRRRFLKTLAGGFPAALLAGCTATGDPEPTATGSHSSPLTPTTQSTPTSLTADDVDFTVEVIRQFTRDHPARVRLSLSYEGERSLFVEGGTVLPFEDYYGEREGWDERLFLIPDDHDHLQPVDESDDEIEAEIVPNSTAGGCWQASYHGFAVTGFAATAHLSGESMAASSTIEREYTLLGSPTLGCDPDGSYRFTDNLTLQQGDRESLPDTESDWYTISPAFTVSLNGGWNIEVDVSPHTIQSA